jgi:hypothetical protein
MELYLGLAITTLLGSGAGSFLGAYLKKKGENLATHEDIDRLVVQVSAVTTATKEIESKITSEVWDQQRRWELKREALFEATKRIAPVKDKLTALYSVYMTEKQSATDDSHERLEKKIRVFAEWNDAANGLELATSLVALVCGQGVTKSLLSLSLFTRNLAHEITQGKPEAFTASLTVLVLKLDATTATMRKEIGIEEVP